MTNGAAIGNVAVKPAATGEDLFERSLLKQIPRYFLQGFAGIENISVGVDAREHSRKTFEVPKLEHRSQKLGSAIDRLLAFTTPFDNLLHQRAIPGVLLQPQVRELLVQGGLRRKHESLLTAEIENALNFLNVPFFDHGADGNVTRA